MGMITNPILQTRKLRLREEKYLRKGLIGPGFACRCVPPKPSPSVMVLHHSASRAMKSQMVLHNHIRKTRGFWYLGSNHLPKLPGHFPPRLGLMVLCKEGSLALEENSRLLLLPLLLLLLTCSVSLESFLPLCSSVLHLKNEGDVLDDI